jgi:micrococcal nuclease
MKGVIIKNLKLTKVIDGDTIKILLDEKVDSIRFVCLDTEESQHGSIKPMTYAGILASIWAKEYFGANTKGGYLPTI